MFPKFPVSATSGCFCEALRSFWRYLPSAQRQLQSHFVTVLQGKAAARVVDLHDGQALYLPAGWFHEV